MRRTLSRMIIVLLLIALLVAFAGWYLLRLSLPEAGVHVPGLAAQVSIHYDEWQRPFVTAATLGDALQAQGWLHASNRLWQMELLRRAGQGLMSQLLGSDLLQTDETLWRAGVPQLASRLQENASVATLELIDQYLAGVNTAIRDYPVLPPEFLLLGASRHLWQRRDVFALGALMAYQSANNAGNELLRLALSGILDNAHMAAFLSEHSERADYPFVMPREGNLEQLLAVMDSLASTDPAHNALMPRLAFGSNGWVVAPHKSASGVALYAFDSHDTLGLPNLFYEVHLFFGAGSQLRGWSVAGLPGVINGFNESIAWGFTNIGDTQDLFLETRSADDAMLFLDGDQWYRARTEIVTIPVNGAANSELTIIHTRNGPLLSEEPALSLAWTAHRLEHANLDSLLKLNLARDWSAFTAALDTYPAPTLNATYADVHGTIGFRTAGAIPRRGRGEGLVPLDGSDPANRWQGMVPAAQMPQLSNPPAGFIAAANARVNAADEGPLISADNAAPYRIARIRQVLASKQKISIQDMQNLQMDWHDGQAEMLLPTMLQHLDSSKLTPRGRSAVALLTHWREKPVASPDSAPALIFQQWYLSLAARLFQDATGELYPRLLQRAYLLNNALDYLVLDDEHSLWWQGDRGAILSAALNDAVAGLSHSLGSEPGQWRLEQRQRVELRHELGKAVPALGWFFNRPDQPWGGSTATVGRARYSYLKPFAVNTGATVRAVAEMTAVPRVYSVIPGGQSGHPMSPHYADQYPGWLAGKLYPIAALPPTKE